MTRRTLFSRLLAGTILATLAAGTGHAASRDADLIGSFQQICMSGRPSVATIEQKAQAMQLGAGQSASQPSGSNGTINSRIWQGTLASGPYQIVGSDTEDSRGHLISCGLTAQDADGNAFRQDLMAALKLGDPTSKTPVPNSNMILLSWRDALGPDTVLQYMQSTDQGAPGIMVSYAAKAQ